MQGKPIFRVGRDSRTGKWTFRETVTPAGERVISVSPDTHRRALDAAASSSRATEALPKPENAK